MVTNLQQFLFKQQLNRSVEQTPTIALVAGISQVNAIWTPLDLAGGDQIVEHKLLAQVLSQPIVQVLYTDHVVGSRYYLRRCAQHSQADNVLTQFLESVISFPHRIHGIIRPARVDTDVVSTNGEDDELKAAEPISVTSPLYCVQAANSIYVDVDIGLANLQEATCRHCRHMRVPKN